MPALVQSPARATTAPSLSARASAVAGELRGAYVRLDRLDEAFNQAQMKVTRLRHAVALENAAVGTTERRLSRDTVRLRTVAIAAYVTGATSSRLTVLLDVSRVQSGQQQAYLAAASGNLSSSISAVKADRSRLAKRQADLLSTERSASAIASRIGRDRRQAARTTASLEATLAKVKGKLAQMVGMRASGSSAAVGLPRPVHRNHHATRRWRWSGVGGGSGAAAVRAAESQLGVPYMWGGATPGVGFDCSGLTMWAWGQAGVSLSHGATDQYAAIRHVSMSALQPGDLIFYGSPGYLYHVVMYVGSGPYGRRTVIQAAHSGTTVSFTPLYGGYFGAGRP